mmetsp:Transcript_33272/g.40837  ORF Transcript_33272/g.40837 Transcript_33272/m.40837 type:complete len:473 (-) Transcript_33272:123-1541(-)
MKNSKSMFALDNFGSPSGANIMPAVKNAITNNSIERNDSVTSHSTNTSASTSSINSSGQGSYQKIKRRLLARNGSGLSQVLSFLSTASTAAALDECKRDDESRSLRIYTKIFLNSPKSGGRKKLGRHVEPKKTFEDSYGNELFSFGICQEIGFKDQDKYDIEVENYCFASVFDGHGNTAAAAEYCMENLYNQIGIPEKGCLPSDEDIINAYKTCNMNICNFADEDPRTGTCAVTVFLPIEEDRNFIEDPSTTLESESKSKQVINQESVTGKVAWCGDCRALLVSQNGKSVQQLTKDHRIDVNEEEKKRIEASLKRSSQSAPRDGLMDTKAWEDMVKDMNKIKLNATPHSFIGKRVNENGQEVGNNCIFAHTGGVSLEVTRSIGDKYAARSVISTPELKTFTFDKREGVRLILASDGLFDVFDNKAVAKIASKISDPRKAAKKLASRAKKLRLYGGKGMDDITVVIVDVCHNL